MQDLHIEIVRGIGKELEELYNLQQKKVKANVAVVQVTSRHGKEEDLEI